MWQTGNGEVWWYCGEYVVRLPALWLVPAVDILSLEIWQMWRVGELMLSGLWARLPPTEFTRMYGGRAAQERTSHRQVYIGETGN